MSASPCCSSCRPSSIGKKVVMALTGLVLAGFVLGRCGDHRAFCNRGVFCDGRFHFKGGDVLTAAPQCVVYPVHKVIPAVNVAA